MNTLCNRELHGRHINSLSQSLNDFLCPPFTKLLHHKITNSFSSHAGSETKINLRYITNSSVCTMLLPILISTKNLHFTACVRQIFKGTYNCLEAAEFMQNCPLQFLVGFSDKNYLNAFKLTIFNNVTFPQENACFP